jgi:Domain of unknown function (DUF5069)
MTTTTTTLPRSVHEKYLGIVQLARTIDKAKMVGNGTIGEYRYNCPMDQSLFTEFGLDAKMLSKAVAQDAQNGGSASAVEAYVKPLVQNRSALDIERFNRDTLGRKPTGESLTAFNELRAKIAPDRTDVTTWPDLLDIDEHRVVPKRATGV